MIRSMFPIDVSRFRDLIARIPRCLYVCATAVRGSAGTLARFQQDLSRATQIFDCASVSVRFGGYREVVDDSLLDLTGWTTTAVSPDAMRLLSMGPQCTGRVQPTVYAYYVRTLGGGYNGIGRPNFANNAPGLVVSDDGNSDTFAHEIGHILMGTAHSTDTNNIMYFDSPNITSDPPVITADQCRMAAASTIPVACQDLPVVPPRQVPRLIPRLPLPGPLMGLLSDEPGVVERFASMGPAMVPALLERANDANPAIRARVLAVLARIGTPAAIQAVARAARSDMRPSVRAGAAAALALAGNFAVAPLREGLMLENDPGVRAAILRSLASVQTPTGQMAIGMAAIREVNPAVRQLAARLATGLS
ncbi:MAG TPA: HEAT repeat domain-containing protein [Symbiobacteriaceae bacterium]|nr:HEAT repeat domain-containing protein [Symbiobacteriaceae bacterium]